MTVIFVASSPQLAALSSGGVLGYPSVLLQQFKSNDSSIHVDMDTATWIASVHGLAGMLSLLMPSVMQLRGRKFTFIMSCLIILTGWTVIYSASNALIVIVGELFQGFGNKSLLVVSYLTISEMVDPKFRNISMLLYGINQILGITTVHVMGRFLHWKTISLIMSSPIVLAVLLSCIWPESPAWLAYKGEFDKCERAFIWLRGNDEVSRAELKALVDAQKELLGIKLLSKRRSDQRDSFSKRAWIKITSRDFYLPATHMFVLLALYYWSGSIVLLIYATDMIEQATVNKDAAFIGMIVIDVVTAISSTISSIFLKYFNNKPVIISSGIGSAVFLLAACLISFLQSTGSIARESFLTLYFLIGFMISSSLGMFGLSFSMPAELIPIKHRGLGGALYVLYLGILYTSSLKISPYLFLYIDLHGTFLMYAVITILCVLYIWKYVPETKNKSLQEIVNCYVKNVRKSTYADEKNTVIVPIVKPENFE